MLNLLPTVDKGRIGLMVQSLSFSSHKIQIYKFSVYNMRLLIRVPIFLLFFLLNICSIGRK